MSTMFKSLQRKCLVGYSRSQLFLAITMQCSTQGCRNRALLKAEADRLLLRTLTSRIFALLQY